MVTGRKKYWGGAVILMIVLLSSCVLPARFKVIKSCDDPQFPVWVVNHGYHTSLVLPAKVFSDQILVDSAFLNYNFIEFAWGDSAYYMADDPGISQALKALFVATPSVVHVVVFNENPQHYFSKIPIKKVLLCRQEQDQLTTFISASFQKNDQKTGIFIQPGLYGKSGFYSSGRTYHLFYTCNNWVVSGLRKAGQITPLWSPFSWPVMWYL